MRPSTTREVAALPPGDILGLIQQQDHISPRTGQSIRWSVLAEHASAEAYAGFQRGCRQDAYQWSAVAIEIYDRLAYEAIGEVKSKYELARMRARCNAIHYCGPSQEDARLDPRLVERWFFEYLDNAPPFTTAYCSTQETLSTDDLMRALDLEARLAVIRPLLKADLLERKKEILALLETHSCQPPHGKQP